jgi:hypothetical protein
MGVFCILVSVDKYMSKLTVGSVKMGWRAIYFLLGGMDFLESMWIFHAIDMCSWLRLTA